MTNERPGGWRTLALSSIVMVVAACAEPPPRSDSIAVAEAFIDAFYSWNGDRLSSLVSPGADADNVLYYQGWAEAAHYRIQQRHPCRALDRSEVVCEVTVTDDFGAALGYTATDTFTMTIRDGVVAEVSFAGDDPPAFEALFAWLSETRPEVFGGPCKDMFNGGTTPGDCARVIARGARDFAAR